MKGVGGLRDEGLLLGIEHDERHLAEVFGLLQFDRMNRKENGEVVYRLAFFRLKKFSFKRINF